MAKILYVEDDENLSFVTKDNLEIAGHKVFLAQDGKEGKELLDQVEVDLCILDIMLPKLDGFSLAEVIRKENKELPIIFLSARSMHEDKIKGLRLGADDYMIKPFSIEELLLKVDVFLKRSGKKKSKTLQQLKIGDSRFDHRNLELNVAGKDHRLTKKEADLLALFIAHKGNVLERPFILMELWGDDDYFTGRSLDVFVSKLRSYLKEDEKIKLENIHGVGFKLRETA